MKRIILTFALVAFAATALADGVAKKPSFQGFVSNGFWDNWEVSANIGAGTALSAGTNLGNLGDRIGFEGNISATKWMHPVVGMRLQLQGGRFINFDYEYGREKWPYMFVHTDFMLNLSNWIGGYREDRAYYAVPFFGLGYMASNFTDKAHRDNIGTSTHQSFAFAYGILNKFRISPSVDFNIELKGLLAPTRMTPVRTCSSYLYGFSATAGFTYRFNKRGWERGVAGYTADDIRAFQQAVTDSNDALAAAQAENARLNDALKAAQAEAAAAKAAAEKPAPVVEKATCPSSVIFYNIGMSKLTSQEKTRLELIADNIKQGAADKVYTIQGHADKQTGTAALNKRLSEKRAKAVYDFLVGKGVNPKQLTYEGLGDTNNPFPIQKANRSAVID